jgi:hypothetical protein
MPAPMQSASPTNSRSAEIAAKELAVRRKLSDYNSKNKNSALVKLKKNKAKVATERYNLKSIRTGDGFTRSDYGVGKGAGIPYQIKQTSATVNKGRPNFKPPKPRPKAPTPKFPPSGVIKPMPRPTPSSKSSSRSEAISRALTTSIKPGDKR